MKPLLLFTMLMAITPALLAAEAPARAASAASAASEADGLTDGEVRKIDLGAGRLTLRHGEIKPLDMPPMTMVFQVRDKRLLEGLKVGDSVRFRAAQEGGTLVATEIRRGPATTP